MSSMPQCSMIKGQITQGQSSCMSVFFFFFNVNIVFSVVEAQKSFILFYTFLYVSHIPQLKLHIQAQEKDSSVIRKKIFISLEAGLCIIT